MRNIFTLPIFQPIRLWIATILTLGSFLLTGCTHTKPNGEITIQAVRFTGDTFYIPHPQPIWTFAITNSGKTEMEWTSGIEEKGGSNADYSRAGGHIDWPEGTLAPGQGLETNMIVPAKPGTAWRAYVEYRPAAGKNRKTFKDVWHDKNFSHYDVFRYTFSTADLSITLLLKSDGTYFASMNNWAKVTQETGHWSREAGDFILHPQTDELSIPIRRLRPMHQDTTEWLMPLEPNGATNALLAALVLERAK
jgi:hypothetical protein